jgi:serine/threonine protein kinase
MIGKTISHYVILEKLGEGGMGVVYKAQDTKLDRFVALKFLPPHLLGSEEEKTRFIHEAKAAAALNHNNICTVYEIDEFHGQTFIAMEYIEGQSLKDKINKGPFKIEEASDIAIQISEGLKKAHDQGIIHRDMKSANILISNDGVAKIVDFGLAKLSGRTQITKSGSTLGTAAYMSPEQTKGQEVDHRSDIWSLGVVLYEMITGQLPFKGDYEQAVIYAIQSENPEPITGLRTGIPVELERIVNGCLEKDPETRLPQVETLIVELKKVKRDIDKDAVSIKDTEPSKKKQTNITKTLIAPTGVVILLLFAYMLFWPRGDTIDSIAILPFTATEGQKDIDWLIEGIPEEIIANLQTIPEFRVIPYYTTRYFYKKVSSDFYPEQVGKELNVRTVVFA